jgi:hypothetical protein
VPLLETFLDRVEAARIEGLGPVPDPSSPRPPGRLLCHSFSRSLSTGEAEIASRGFFDSLDRPPIALWLEVVSRPMPRGSEAFEVCVLAFVPEQILARAIAGRKACPSGALAFLAEVSPTLTGQLDVGGVPILENGR